VPGSIRATLQRQRATYAPGSTDLTLIYLQIAPLLMRWGAWLPASLRARLQRQRATCAPGSTGVTLIYLHGAF
jgi:hypothetical protein